jgi:PDZ domain-containing protein
VKAIPLWVKLLGGIGVVAAVCVGLTFVPSGDVAYAPIAPIDLDGKITVDGNPVEPLQGRLYLVGVTERKVNLLERMLLDVSDPGVDFGPAPTGPATGPRPGDVRSMDEAKQVSAGVAFDLAGRPVTWAGTGATVALVDPKGPSAGRLQRGDFIVTVNGTPVDTSVDAGRLIHRQPPGSVVTLGVQRAGVASRVQVRTIAPTERWEGSPTSVIGVDLSTIGLQVKLPQNVGIDSGEVVGPSAGLPFALYLVDTQQRNVDLLAGRNVVATGALAPDGKVLPVGRVRQKALAAQAAKNDLFLVPVANAAEANKAIAESCESGCIKVVPVHNVAEAISLLQLDDAALTGKLGSAGARGHPRRPHRQTQTQTQ